MKKLDYIPENPIIALRVTASHGESSAEKRNGGNENRFCGEGGFP